MVQYRISRRRALKVAGGSVVLCVLPGCGSGGSSGIREAGRVIIKVAIQIAKVLSVVLKVVDGILTIVAIIDGVRKTITANPTNEQVAQLNNGGKLILEGSDGRQFEMPFTVQ